jgi:hypothetical protein
MKQTSWTLGLGALLLVACGSDDKETPMASGCPEGSVAGVEVACSCGDAGTGRAICQADGFPGACDCDGDGDGGGAGGSSGGSGGAGGSTSGTGGSSGEGGTGNGDDDGGTDPGGDGDGDGDASVPPLDLPDDGNQGSVCVDDRDCNRDLGCYVAGFEGQGFCSALCETEADCEAIEGASYVCSMLVGVCEVECEGEDDTQSCPEPMVCTNTGFGPGQGGESFRCKYPGDTAPAEAAGLLELCSLFVPCEEGLLCNPTGSAGNGFCTVACEAAENDCSELDDAAGDATPECTNLPGPAGGERCTLDCREAEDGCPGDMTCIRFGPMSRCGYE